jgi:membrane protease subunit HflK
MKVRWWLAALLGAAYAASGFYLVKGNEQALVRRCGKVRAVLAVSGLHYELPWPFTRVDRVNLNEVRTLAIGLAADRDQADILQPARFSRQAEFLTGDKNILSLQVHVQYRVSDARQYFLHSESPERHLRFLAESMVTDVVARSGVDFVHPLGLNELRRLLSARTRELADLHQLGLVVEDVTIGDVRPPAPVKQAFLEVSNARAGKDRLINEAHSESERMLARAQALARQELDRAETQKQQQVAEAQGAAGRFLALIAQFERDAEQGIQTYAQSRQMALQRLYLSTWEEILPNLAGQVFVDGERPIDLTIQRGTRD